MEESGSILGCIIFLCFIATSIGLGYLLAGLKPSAMDVYQGNTTLEYTIVDGMKIDSCVIFKK